MINVLAIHLRLTCTHLLVAYCVTSQVTGLAPLSLHFITPLIIKFCTISLFYYMLILLGECIALWGEPNELSIQYHVYIFMQYVDS